MTPLRRTCELTETEDGRTTAPDVGAQERRGSTLTRAAWLAALVIGGASSGCQRDPMETKVSAGTATAFSAWRAHVASDSSAELRRRIDEALLEIRLKIAGDREMNRISKKPELLDGDSVDEAVRKKVMGRPLREMLQLGYELRVMRLKAELGGLEDSVRKNSQLVTKPGDLESKHHLEGLRDRQLLRIEKYRSDIAAAERELALVTKGSGKSLLPPPAEQPTDTPDEPAVRLARPK